MKHVFRVAALVIVFVCSFLIAVRTQGQSSNSKILHEAGKSGEHEVGGDSNNSKLNRDLAAGLSAAAFTGNIEQTFRQRLERNLGRPIKPKMAELGTLPCIDKLHAPHPD